MTWIPEDIHTFLSLDSNGQKNSIYSDKKITILSGGKNYLDKLSSTIYHEITSSNLLDKTIPWKVEEYIKENLKICSRDKFWDKNVNINLLTSIEGFVVKYFDDSSYFKDSKNFEKFKTNGIYDSIKNGKIFYFDNISPSIYFGLRKNNDLFKK